MIAMSLAFKGNRRRFRRVSVSQLMFATKMDSFLPHLFVLLSVALFASVNGVTFDDCGAQTGDLQKITVTGCTDDPVCTFKAGTNVTFDASFTSKTASTSATIKVQGIIGGIPLPFPIKPSEACGNWGITCPINNGSPYELNVSMPILRKYPKIKVTVRIQLLDSEQKKLICVQFPTQITA